MTYKILKHKTKEGVYGKLMFSGREGKFLVSEFETPKLFHEFPKEDLPKDYDLVEVEIKEGE